MTYYVDKMNQTCEYRQKTIKYVGKTRKTRTQWARKTAVVILTIIITKKTTKTEINKKSNYEYVMCKQFIFLAILQNELHTVHNTKSSTVIRMMSNTVAIVSLSTDIKKITIITDEHFICHIQSSPPKHYGVFMRKLKP